MKWILASLAITFATLGGVSLARAEDGLQTRQVAVGGVPLYEVRQAGQEPKPGVVVAHGFAGSARLMAGFGDTLARRGFVVVLLDFSGHGANRHGPPSADRLASDLDVAVGHLRSLSGVDPQRLFLVGHSMGATAVTRYAAEHPQIRATVAISLPEATDLPDHLLVLVGAAEFPRFHQAADQVASSGLDRRAVEIPGVEHISILYAPRTHEEMLTWLEAGDGPAPSPANRALAAVMLLVAFGVGFYPLATALLGPVQESRPAADNLALVWVFAACALASVAAAVIPLGWMHIAVSGYVVAFTVVAGLLLVGAARRSRNAAAAVRHVSPTAVLVLCGYSAAAVAIPLHLGVTHALPGGQRWWLLAVIVAGYSLFSYGCLRWTGGRFWPILGAFAIAVVVLTGAALIGVAPGFLVLIVPLLAVLLAWQAAWTAVLTRLAAPAWLTILVGSLLPALPSAVALPLLR